MNSNQPTPGVKRNIPGPTSKILKRRNGNGEAETFNGKTNCLFCSNTVLISSETNAKNDEDQKRIRLLKNLCNHVMKTNQDEPPTFYSPEAFPFCSTCQKYVDQLWEYDEIVRNGQIKIAQTILKIQKAVVDGEVLNGSVSMSTATTQLSSTTVTPVKDKRFLKLRGAFFTGYRNNLLMKQKISEKLLEANERRRSLAQLQAVTSSREETEHVNNSNLSPNGLDVEEIPVPEKRQQELSCTPCITLFTSDEEMEDVPSERNEDTTSETQDKGDSQETPANDVTLDMSLTNAVIDDSSEMDTGSSESGSAELTTPTANFTSQNIGRESRNREGVIISDLIEIYWTSGSMPDVAYLDCSMCTQEIMFSTRKAEGLSHALQIMQIHMTKKHQEEKNRIRSITKKHFAVYPCASCSVSFTDTLARDKHEDVHRTCEICRKLIGRKGCNNIYSMRLHAKTHTKEAERKAWAEAGEKGYVVRHPRMDVK